jgi:hypothetical protein
MSEASLRQALVAAIIAAVAGVVALALGAFIAPIPSQTNASQVATALFVRGMLALIALALALFFAYGVGYRIEGAEAKESLQPLPQPDPSASSPLVSLFTTPGTRRDAVFAGGIVMLSYWLLTTLYIAALGKYIGNVGFNPADAGSFISSHITQGLVLIAAGLGCGGLGSRAALARKLTSKALSIPALPPDLPPAAGSAPADPSAPQE